MVLEKKVNKKQSITISCTDDKNDFKEVNKNWKVFSLFKKILMFVCIAACGR